MPLDGIGFILALSHPPYCEAFFLRRKWKRRPRPSLVSIIAFRYPHRLERNRCDSSLAANYDELLL